MSAVVSVRRTTLRPWRWPLTVAYRAAETVLMLPVLLSWFLLYRWCPDPP